MDDLNRVWKQYEDFELGLDKQLVRVWVGCEDGMNCDVVEWNGWDETVCVLCVCVKERGDFGRRWRANI